MVKPVAWSVAWNLTTPNKLKLNLFRLTDLFNDTLSFSTKLLDMMLAVYAIVVNLDSHLLWTLLEVI